jgi:exodeoxyribonuclease VII small subunit
MPEIETTFEGALGELEAIVKGLEEGKVNLEDAVSAYERGMALKTFCEDKLRQARLRVEQIALSSTGDLTLSGVPTDQTGDL